MENAGLEVVTARLSDGDLEDRLKKLVGIERKALALLLAHLGEFDERRLHADRGHPSLFSYCMTVLGYSEQAAYKRIQAARAARVHPEILLRLEAGNTNLTAIVILAPHLRQGNVGQLFDAARGKRTRDIEFLAAKEAPRADCPDLVRALPASRGLIEPLSQGRSLFRFTGGGSLLKKFDRARELMEGTKTGGAMEAIFESALDSLLDKRDPQRRIARRKERVARVEASNGAATPSSRRIAAPLRDAIWERDGGRCTFVESGGERCPSNRYLEIDHVRPFAVGGSSDDADNLRLLCRAHNQLLARRIFGDPKRGAQLDLDYPQG